MRERRTRASFPQGYIRVARYGDTSKGEPCLTDTSPGDGDGCKGGPSSASPPPIGPDRRVPSLARAGSAQPCADRAASAPPLLLPRAARTEIQVCGLCGILSDSSYVIGGHLI